MVRIIKAAKGNINTKHGEDAGRSFPHVGIDIGWGEGLELFAPADGFMTWARVGTYGNRVIIKHDDGTWSLIAHAAVFWVQNARVQQGQHIGTMGRTGGPWGAAGWFVHCHQEYHLANGAAVDPLKYMGSTPAGGGTFKPIGGHDVAKYSRKQLATALTVRNQWQRWPNSLSPRVEDLAGGAGGGGLYDMILNFYFDKLTAGKQVQGRIVLVNAKTGKGSNGYEFTVDGNASGKVQAAVPARVSVPGGSYLYLELRGNGDPVCTLWGADIANLTVA